MRMFLLIGLLACGGGDPDVAMAPDASVGATCDEPDSMQAGWNPDVCVCRLGRTRCGIGSAALACCLSDSVPPYDATNGLPYDCSPFPGTNDDSRFETLTRTIEIQTATGPIECPGQPYCAAGTCVDDGTEPVRCTCEPATCTSITCGTQNMLVTITCGADGTPTYTRC